MSLPPAYVLGSADPEIARLDLQAEAIAPATQALLRAAGIRPGMRVLDLGTGLGSVAFMLAELVAPGGHVTGVDREDALLAVAEQRRAGRDDVEFRVGDVRTYRADAPVDAITARLLLFHLPDAVEVVRRHLASLAPGGRFVALDFDIGTSRGEPAVPLFEAAIGWVHAGFRHAGANPRVGARLGPILRAAGLQDVTTFGIQAYLAPDDAGGPRMLAGVVRSLAPAIVASGAATEEEIGLDTLESRLREAVVAADSVQLIPGLVGAWGVASGA